MKTEQFDPPIKETSALREDSPKKTCPQGHLATRVCSNKRCNSIAYICSKKQCQYQQAHSECSSIKIDKIWNKVSTQIASTSYYHQSVLNKIQVNINKLSTLKEKFQDLFRQLCSNTQNITGKQIFQMLDQPDAQTKSAQQLEQKFTELWQSIDQEIQNQSTQLIQLLESTHNQKILNSNLFIEQITKNTKIRLNQKDALDLFNMFDDEPPKSAKLLYRASQHAFKSDKFHDKSDNIPHTLTLCETNYRKVIGGYTPLVWDLVRKNQVDESGRSFIFSLTNNHKFTLKDKTKPAIFSNKKFGPTFGDDYGDICIVSSSDTQKSSATINKSYFNDNYTADDYDSYTKFTGNMAKSSQSYRFKTEDYQVWQLEFDQ